MLSTAETLTVARQPQAVSQAESGLQAGLHGVPPSPASQKPEPEVLNVTDLADTVKQADLDLQQVLTGLLQLPGPAGQELSSFEPMGSMEMVSAASMPGPTRPELHPAAAAQPAEPLPRVAWNQTGLPHRSLLHDGALRAGQAMLPGEACKVEVVAGFPWQQHAGSWLNTVSMRVTNTGALACHASRWCKIGCQQVQALAMHLVAHASG